MARSKLRCANAMLLLSNMLNWDLAALCNSAVARLAASTTRNLCISGDKGGSAFLFLMSLMPAPGKNARGA